MFQGKANTWYTLEVSQTKNQYGKVTLINHEYKNALYFLGTLQSYYQW